MTHKEALTAIRQLGLIVRYDSSTGEYEIRERGSKTDGYFTSDRFDAVDTARTIAATSR